MQSQEQFPQEHNKRLKDKLHYRYPGVGGESYLDVIERIRPVIIGHPTPVSFIHTYSTFIHYVHTYIQS